MSFQLSPRDVAFIDSDNANRYLINGSTFTISIGDVLNPATQPATVVVESPVVLVEDNAAWMATF